MNQDPRAFFGHSSVIDELYEETLWNIVHLDLILHIIDIDVHILTII